ncbi:H-type small acid-soluble spore protein [Cellulosilyticum sp. I15G10I2]|uniref:H-type small acid-soluble spore protein n=1 Tax=Cellulosilyticum sp. I15G10I2 TaxID=1892843 RepID=UPI00085C9E9B|nr:H-type small acid-soluble spore protein [Cellulosilyticum sp. I15G10I2]
MDKNRAKEIASCPTMMNVTCNGVPIYIENINEKSNTANIHALDQPERKEEVSLSSLVEH